MAKAKQLPSGAWRVQASKTVNGTLIRRSFTDTDPRRAELKATQWQNELFTVYREPNKATLEMAIQRYIDNRRGLISPTTIATYERMAKNYFLQLQKMSLSKITINMLQAEVNRMAVQPLQLSPKSIKNAYSLVAAAIKEATGETLNIKLPKAKKIIYATPDQKTAHQILSAAKGTDIELPVTLALRLGLRVSEICGLKWSAVHDDYILIDNVIVNYGQQLYEKAPKSAAGHRKIPLPADIKELINKQPKIDEYIYHKNGNAIGSAFKRLLKRNNIPHCRFHDLRHANASAMAMLGIPERYAMAIGGWDTPTVLRQIYQQTFTDAEINFAKMLDKYFVEDYTDEEKSSE